MKEKKENLQPEEEIIETELTQEAVSGLDVLQGKLDEKDEQLKRLAAEYDNFRKRSAKEREAVYQDAKISVISEFLSVLDNFDRAKDAEGSAEDYRKGVELIFTQFSETLKALGVEVFGEAGDEFDPLIHSAVMHVEDEEAGENTILEVFQKGYQIGDRIIRHAMVKVAN